MAKKISIEFLCVKEYNDDKNVTPHQLPIYATSSFSFDHVEESAQIFNGEKDGYVYSRYGNPTVEVVAQKLADLEGYGTGLKTYGFMTSSGMSAISVLMMALLRSGDTILTQEDLYGGTTELFQKVLSNLGIKVLYCKFDDIEVVEHMIQTNRNIKMIYFETPANPVLTCIDIYAVAKIAKKHGVWSCVDNTFCTPVIQQPLGMGVDFVIHSTTKYLNGHGNSIAGVIISHLDKLKNQIGSSLKLIGATCNPWDAWLINNGMKTLYLRMLKHSENAGKLAEYLHTHPRVNQVNYNGLKSNRYHEIAIKQMKYFGGMLSFEVDGGAQRAFNVINNLKYCTIAPTLGDVDTLVLHPATSSHLKVDKTVREANGITDGLIRVSVGIEDVTDIIEDFEQALKK